jgi:hypothetical protein
LRADKFAETYLIDELETTYLLSMIGGLWCSIIGPFGLIVRMLATQHFKALMIRSVYSFNNSNQDETREGESLQVLKNVKDGKLNEKDIEVILNRALERRSRLNWDWQTKIMIYGWPLI